MSAERIVIAVDGLAASGKSALSRALAERLGYIHLSSGLIYRALALLALESGVDADDCAALCELLGRHRIVLDADERGSAQVYIDGKAAPSTIFEPRVSEMTSRVSRHPQVRASLLDIQRSAFPGRNLVVEGRDIGTVVFPEAKLKFFIEADEAVRIERRREQMTASGRGAGSDASVNQLKRGIEIEIRERDRRDSERPDSPAKPAPDAVIIDNSRQTLTAVVESMYDFAFKRGLI